MILSGEMMSILENIEFESKQELLLKLKKLRFETKNLSSHSKQEILQILTIAIQQIYYADERQIVNYKKFINSRKRTNKW